jgi:tagatose 1,6-diphosphate aldolase GatY/KbaY
MQTSTAKLLEKAAAGGYAVGAFNVYNLEGARAVTAAAEAARGPVMLQLHPGALGHGRSALLALCLAIAHEATVPVAVHLDHSSEVEAITAALAAGITSVMADGSHLAYEENVAFTREMTALAHAQGVAVEAELGRISGTEDGLTVPEFEARFTNPDQAADFVAATGVDALAVCIGNVHGRYSREPKLDFGRLQAIRDVVSVPLVLHGASGLPDNMTRQAIELGITKLNVNTEVRQAFVDALQGRLSRAPKPDLVPLMEEAVAAMQRVVAAKIALFGSAGKA